MNNIPFMFDYIYIWIAFKIRIELPRKLLFQNGSLVQEVIAMNETL